MLAAALAAALAASPLRAQNAPTFGVPREGLVAGLSAKKSTFQLGEPVTLETVVKNVSDKPIYIAIERPSTASLKFSVVRVVGSSRQVVPLTDRGSADTDPRLVGAHNSRRLAPGEETRLKYPITDLYQMTQPGTYEISVRVPSPGRTELQSSAMYIELTAADKQ